MGRRQEAVATVPGPTDGEWHTHSRATKFVDKVLVRSWHSCARLNFCRFHPKTEKHLVGFGKRHAKHSRRLLTDDLVIPTLFIIGTLCFVRQIVSARHPILREIWVGVRDGQLAVVIRRVDVKAEVVARTKHVFLLNASHQRQFFGLRIASTNRQVARRTFHHFQNQINLIGVGRNFFGLYRYLGEVAQTVNTVTRQLDELAIVPSRLHLTEFTANDFITRAIVAFNFYASHIDALLRIGLKHHFNCAQIAVNTRLCLDTSKGIAIFSKPILESLNCGCDIVNVVSTTRLDLNQGLKISVASQIFASQFDTTDRIPLPFGDVDRDGHVGLVGANGHLGRVDPKFHKALIQVKRLDGFEIGIEFGLRVAI